MMPSRIVVLGCTCHLASAQPFLHWGMFWSISKTTVQDRCEDSHESGEDNCATFDEKDAFAVDLGEEESDDEEKSVTLYSAAKLP